MGQDTNSELPNEAPVAPMSTEQLKELAKKEEESLVSVGGLADDVKTMENPTLEGLRKIGFKVRVNHFRYTHPGKFNKKTLALLPMFLIPDHKEILPKGGMTVVDIISPAKTRMIGISKCMLIDCFEKKEGVRRALRNAFGLQEEKK